MSRPERLSEVLGLWAGAVIAPVATIGTLIRQGRVLHGRGIYFRAEVKAAAEVPPEYEEIAMGLSEGVTLVRLSSGAWRTRRGVLPDVLGMSVRFNADETANFAAQAESQDLLMATTKSLWLLPISALMSNQRDFMDNNYYGAAKYEVADKPNMMLRVTPLKQSSNSGKDRYDKIRNAVINGDATFMLEIASMFEPTQWIPLAKIRLESEVEIDDHLVEFWPFHTGQSIRPQGFVQFMRTLPYLSSQWARTI